MSSGLNLTENGLGRKEFVIGHNLIRLELGPLLSFDIREILGSF